MPPSRRRLPAVQRPSPTRRPRVAGLRKPSPVPRSTVSDEAGRGVGGTEPASKESRSARPEAGPGSPSESPKPSDPTEERSAEEGGVTDSAEPPESPDPAESSKRSGEDTETAEDGKAAESAEDSPADGAEDVVAPETAAKARSAPAKVGRPSPRPKRRDRGVSRPMKPEQVELADADEERSDAAEAGVAGGAAEGGRERRAGYPVLAALVAATLVLSGLAVFFKLRHSEATELTSNAALVDVATTAEVKQAMSDAAERLFSIDYNDMAKTERAAEQLLGSEEVKSTYDTLMGEYRGQAGEQKIVVTTTAVRSAVVLLDGDRARVMVYVDQTATRAGDEQTVGGPAAMWFETERKDGEWKVMNMDVYGAGQSSGARSELSPNGPKPSSSQAEESTEGN